MWRAMSRAIILPQSGHSHFFSFPFEFSAFVLSAFFFPLTFVPATLSFSFPSSFLSAALESVTVRVKCPQQNLLSNSVLGAVSGTSLDSGLV